MIKIKPSVYLLLILLVIKRRLQVEYIFKNKIYYSFWQQADIKFYFHGSDFNYVFFWHFVCGVDNKVQQLYDFIIRSCDSTTYM